MKYVIGKLLIMSYTQDKQNNSDYNSNTVICPKHDIILMKTPKPNEYTLSFSIVNKNINMAAILDWKIYDLLFSLNKDILSDRFVESNCSDCSQNNNSNDEKHFIYVFKRFGAELGIAQRYLSFNVHYEKPSSNEVLFTGLPNNLVNNVSEPYSNFMNAYRKIEPIISNFSRFSIKLVSNHKLEVTYDYHIDLQEELPASMKNIAGILIKKLFWRFKTCIENLE